MERRLSNFTTVYVILDITLFTYLSSTYLRFLDDNPHICHLMLLLILLCATQSRGIIIVKILGVIFIMSNPTVLELDIV